MKRMCWGISRVLALVLMIPILCSCTLPWGKYDKEHQAAQIMYDIKSSLYLYAIGSEDEQKIQQSIYDFSDLFSDEAYSVMGDLTDTYMQIRSYFSSWLKAFDLQKAEEKGNTLRAVYKIENDRGSSYLYFVADVSDSFHKKGVRFMHIADDMETVEKEEKKEYGIYLNGIDIAPHEVEATIPFRERPVTYQHKKDYAGGDSEGLAKEVADEFMSYLQQGDAVKIRDMFSGSVWRYDLQLENEIDTFLEDYKNLDIESYTVSAGAESGSTSYGSIKNAEGQSFGTHGHGAYRVSFTIAMQTEQGERELDLQVVSEYEPNPCRVGLMSVSDERASVGIWV